MKWLGLLVSIVAAVTWAEAITIEAPGFTFADRAFIPILPHPDPALNRFAIVERRQVSDELRSQCRVRMCGYSQAGKGRG
jgi:hypothetical protein